MHNTIIPRPASQNNPHKSRCCPNARRIATRYEDGRVVVSWVFCRRKSCPVCRRIWREQYLSTLLPLAESAADLRHVAFRGPRQQQDWRRFRRRAARHNAPWAKTTVGPAGHPNRHIAVLLDAAGLPDELLWDAGATRTRDPAATVEEFLDWSSERSHVTLGGPWRTSRPHGGGSGGSPAEKPVERIAVPRRISPDQLKAALDRCGIEYAESFTRWSQRLRCKLADPAMTLAAFFSILFSELVYKSGTQVAMGKSCSPPAVVLAGAT